MERVVRDVVDRPHDPRAVGAEIEHVDARRRLLERAEVRTAAGQRLRKQDPVHPAVEHRERRLPFARDELVEGRQHAVERLTERLAAEEPRGLVAHLERADEELLELVARDVVQPAAAPLGKRRPLLGLTIRDDDRCRLERAWQAARDNQVEADVVQRTVSGCSLLEPALGQAHDLGVALADVRDLGMPHQVEPTAHGA